MDKASRATPIPRRMCIKRGWSTDSTTDDDPCRIHASHGCRIEARPDSYAEESLLWNPLETQHDEIRAACCSADGVEPLLDEWATCLKNRFDELYPLKTERASLKRTTDYMLCAARSRTLRWQAYLRHALAQQPEGVEQTFKFFTKNEFPDVPWDRFLEEFKALGKVLAGMPPATSSPPITTRAKLRDITTRRPIVVQRPA